MLVDLTLVYFTHMFSVHLRFCQIEKYSIHQFTPERAIDNTRAATSTTSLPMTKHTFHRASTRAPHPLREMCIRNCISFGLTTDFPCIPSCICSCEVSISHLNPLSLLLFHIVDASELNACKYSIQNHNPFNDLGMPWIAHTHTHTWNRQFWHRLLFVCSLGRDSKYLSTENIVFVPLFLCIVVHSLECVNVNGFHSSKYKQMIDFFHSISFIFVFSVRIRVDEM